VTYKLDDTHNCVHQLILIYLFSFVGTIKIYIPLDHPVIECDCELDPSGLKIQWQDVVGTSCSTQREEFLDQLNQPNVCSLSCLLNNAMPNAFPMN
jgi:hypothetical protein